MNDLRPHHSHGIRLVGALLALASCAPAHVPEQPGTVPAPASTAGGAASSAPTAPWSASPLPRTAIAPAYLESWSRAENRGRCALLAPDPSSRAMLDEAVGRTAQFSGGWAVAYDLTGERSAFGVAGTGGSAWSPDLYSAWPHRMTWADGSDAGYGLEGGTGPNWLAYLRIPGQECLYNVWSRRGSAHLELLLLSLRRVATS